ncbi:MAG TPA: alkaline phosphatase family protein, partial [Aliidongia sp.]|nr:alkaline phosphatase family protein [Aliidongia sp.]
MKHATLHRGGKTLAALALGTALSTGCISSSFAASPDADTTTPIKHVVVIFQENVSFDHYFGTYPVATNPEGVPQFFPSVDTPTINGLSAVQPTAGPFVLPSQ